MTSSATEASLAKFGPVYYYRLSDDTLKRISRWIGRRLCGFPGERALTLVVDKLGSAQWKVGIHTSMHAFEEVVAYSAINSVRRRGEYRFETETFDESLHTPEPASYVDSLCQCDDPLAQPEVVAQRRAILEDLRACFLAEMNRPGQGKVRTDQSNGRLLKEPTVWPERLSLARFTEAEKAFGHPFRTASYAAAWIYMYSRYSWKERPTWQDVAAPLKGSMEALKTQGKRIQSSVQARMDALLALLCLLLPSALLPRRAQAATPHTTGLGGVRFAGALTSALGIVAGLAVVGLLTFDLGARPPEVAVTAQAPTNLPAPGLNSLLHVVPGAPLPAAARPVPAYPLNGPTGAAINSAALTQASPTASVARRRAAALAAVGSAPAVGPDPDAGDAEAALHSPGPRVPEAPAPDRAQSLAPAKTRFDVGADQTAALELSERIRLARKQGAHTEAVRLASQGGALPSAAARAAAASAVRTGDYAAALHLLDQATVTSTFGAAARDEAHLRAVALAALGQDDEARAARARLPSLARARAWAAGRLARAMGGR